MRYELLNKAVGSRIGVFCFIGVMAVFFFLLVPDTEGIYVFELRAAHHARAPHAVTPHLHISTSDIYT